MIGPILGVLFALVTYLLLDKSQKAIILMRIGLRPTRKPTPEKQKQNGSKPLSSSTSDLVATLPPLLREQLRKLKPRLSAGQQQALYDLSFDEQKCARSLLRFDEDYRDAADDKYVYSGFSVREIKTLGNFPDYAALCEVPLPPPYERFDLDRALPRPYRPFRWSYHQTMSLTKLETDWWIELESSYKERIAQRQALFAQHGEAVLQALPGSELACKELMEMVVQYLCARHPRYFALAGDGGSQRLENRILGTVSVFAAEAPLMVLLNNVPEDFALMLRNPETGYYHFRAGVICSALGWSVATKIGKNLQQIHKIIPDYKEKMQFSMDRFFSKMPANRPIQRGSWGLEVDQPLFMPPGDPHEKYRECQTPDLGIERCNLRVDWQTLRRLPLSGAIVFNFKGLFTPVAELRTEPYIPTLVLKVLREGNRRIMEYKNTWHTEHVILPALEAYEREQIEKGLVERDWEVKTPEQSPFFPGWEEKWHAQQGF